MKMKFKNYLILLIGFLDLKLMKKMRFLWIKEEKLGGVILDQVTYKIILFYKKNVFYI